MKFLFMISDDRLLISANFNRKRKKEAAQTIEHDIQLIQPFD